MAGSTQRDYSFRTLPLLPLDSGDSSSAPDFSLAPPFFNLRVAVLMAVSSLAILLTVVTFLLSAIANEPVTVRPDVRPDPPSQSVGNTIRTYANESGGACDYNGDSALGRKRPPPADPLYDVRFSLRRFPRFDGIDQTAFSSSKRMKTFMVGGSAATLS